MTAWRTLMSFFTKKRKKEEKKDQTGPRLSDYMYIVPVDRLESYLVRNREDRFSRDEAQ